MAEPRRSERPLQLYRFPSRNRTLPVVHGNDCVTALRALGEDTRVRIVGLLIEEAMDVNEIARRLDVSQYNVSKHLRILREAGLLEVAKSGRQRLYALPETIRRRAEAGNILDLGCCSFQFKPAAAPPAPSSRHASRKRAAVGSSRLSR